VTPVRVAIVGCGAIGGLYAAHLAQLEGVEVWAYDVSADHVAAITATAPAFADAAVCSVQNGIGNEEVMAEHVPRVMRGVTLPAGHVTAPGVIHMAAPGTTWIGPFEPRPAAAETH
jgi:2-dehydropantoate 2-reductase